MLPSRAKAISVRISIQNSSSEIFENSYIAAVGALDAYEECLKIEPSNALAKRGLAAVNEAIRKEAEEDGQTPDVGLGSIFADANWLTKLASNPKTAGFLADPAFMAKLVQIKKNPSTMNEELRDPRMMQVIAVLLGLNMEMPPAGPMGTEDTPVGISISGV